jgi:hypothetical protein
VVPTLNSTITWNILASKATIRVFQIFLEPHHQNLLWLMLPVSVYFIFLAYQPHQQGAEETYNVLSDIPNGRMIAGRRDVQLNMGYECGELYLCQK